MLLGFPWDTGKTTVWNNPYYLHEKKGRKAVTNDYDLSFYPRLLATYVHVLLPCNTVSSTTHRHACNEVSTNEDCYHNRRMGDLRPSSPFIRSPTQGTTFLTNLTEVHQDIVLSSKFTDLRVAYATQKSAETKIQCVVIEYSDAAMKAGAMGPTASPLQQKMTTTRQRHALKNILLHDATCFLCWQSFSWSQIFPAFTESKSSYHGVRNRLSLFFTLHPSTRLYPFNAYFSKNIFSCPFKSSRSPSVDILGLSFCRGLTLFSSKYRTMRCHGPYDRSHNTVSFT
jgi:hypothetical protein